MHKIFTFPLRKVFGSTTKKSHIILGQKNQTNENWSLTIMLMQEPKNSSQKVTIYGDLV